MQESSSFLESEESSEDDVNSLEHRMTNEAVVATSAGGLSKSGMGRAAALGMDVGSIEFNTADHLQTKSRNSQSQASLILKKKITSLVKKTKETRELWSSKQFFGRQKPIGQNNESLASDEMESDSSGSQAGKPPGADFFSIDALASQRSRRASLVNKLGMATDDSTDLLHYGNQSSQHVPVEKEMKAGQRCQPASAAESNASKQLCDHDGDETVFSDAEGEIRKPEVQSKNFKRK